MMEIPITLINEFQRNIVFETKRNICGSGGYGNGKTYAGCLKGLILLSTFPKYRIAIVRREYKVLRQTTMKTFFKICPQDFVDRHSENDGYTRLKNGSEILWLNLDKFDEQSLKSLEINSAILDQAEEIDENIHTHLDTRIGRWDMAEVPKELLRLNPNWPQNNITKKYLVPAYMIALCNPDTEFHYLYRLYHPNSRQWRDKYKKTHIMYQAASTENPALSQETLDIMLGKDPEWVERYVKGEWGISSATIHHLLPQSIIEYNDELMSDLRSKGIWYRAMDHGESAPTCCLWFVTLRGLIFCVREYYQPNKLISHHRAAINSLSQENYAGSYADPAIFKKQAQKRGGRFSVADEYSDPRLCEARPLTWTPADNNEFHTRNRISELLKLDSEVEHPITGETNSPKLYFIKKSNSYPHGCDYVISETKLQRRIKLGDVDGKPIYGDEREVGLPDHAYDPLRYFIGVHASRCKKAIRKINPRSFRAAQARIKKMAAMGVYN